MAKNRSCIYNWHMRHKAKAALLVSLFAITAAILILLDLAIYISMPILAAASALAFFYMRKYLKKFEDEVHKPILNISKALYNVQLKSLDINAVEFSGSEYLKELIESINDLSKRLQKSVTRIEDNIQIGHALAVEKNHYRLFHTILYYAKKITGADAGSIFIVENLNDKKQLRFKYSHTFSKNLPYEEFTMPMDKNSIAGYVAVTGKTLNIPDAYEINPAEPYKFNRQFDITNKYRTKSQLTVPMLDHLNNVMGVIQLINCKENKNDFSGNEAYEIVLNDDDDINNYVAPFSAEIEKLTLSIAGEAGVALENIQMINRIKHQFDAFVSASVTAIESRDPPTRGHSQRVSVVSKHIAMAINDEEDGIFAYTFFTEEQIKELEYAAMVHDFGKIYIEPAVFLKGKKLFLKDYQYLKLRLNFLKTIIKNAGADEKLQTGSAEMRAAIDEEYNSKLESLEVIVSLLDQVNDPTARIEDLDGIIDSILEMQKDLDYKGPDGEKVPILTDNEIINLRIKKGSLNPEERKIIEGHVNYSYSFVNQIPWPQEYSMIPEIVLCHHELLDGSGYPSGRKGKDDIPIQARIMTVADIFDALIASDRPYKKAVPLDVVLKILREEASAGKLDIDLVELFIAKKIYEISE